MSRTLDDNDEDDCRKLRYLSYEPLKLETIGKVSESLKDKQLSSVSDRFIIDVDMKKEIIEFRGPAKRYKMKFRHIYNSDSIMRYHLGMHRYPTPHTKTEPGDYRSPHPSIGVERVNSDSDAPRIVELIYSIIEETSLEDLAHRHPINEEAYETASAKIKYDIDSVEALEGYQSDKIYLHTKRNREIVQKRKIKDGFKCQSCGFKLDVGGKFIIECHHNIQLADTGEIVTNINDLVCLCPTCHRISHTCRPPLPVAQVKVLMAARES